MYMTKLLQSDWLSGINDFRDGWGEREIKTTKVQYGSEIYLA